MTIPTPEKAKQAVDIMFKAMEEHYEELEGEANQFFKDHLVKLPAQGTMIVCVFGGLQFHCLHHKGRRVIVPESMVPDLKKTTCKKVLRKRYALNVFYSSDRSTLNKLRCGVLEVLPSIAQGKKLVMRHTPDPGYPGICQGLRVTTKFDYLLDPQAILSRPVFEITRIKEKKGCARYEVKNVKESLRRFGLSEHNIRGYDVGLLDKIYQSDLWEEKVRDTLAEMESRGLL